MLWGEGHRGRYCERSEPLILATGRQLVCPAAELDPVIPSGGSPGSITTAAPAGESESASIINPTAFDSQTESGWTVALQSSVSNNSNSASTAEKKSGSLLDHIA
jgi:hypothetical protein